MWQPKLTHYRLIGHSKNACVQPLEAANRGGAAILVQPRGTARRKSAVQASPRSRRSWRRRGADLIDIEAGGTQILFRASSAKAVRRAETLLTKEPGTIAWIEGFTEDDVFWDVGALWVCIPSMPAK